VRIPKAQSVRGEYAYHEVVERDGVLEKVVDTSHDAKDTEREDPDTDDGDDGSLLAVLEPTK